MEVIYCTYNLNFIYYKGKVLRLPHLSSGKVIKAKFLTFPLVWAKQKFFKCFFFTVKKLLNLKSKLRKTRLKFELFFKVEQICFLFYASTILDTQNKKRERNLARVFRDALFGGEKIFSPRVKRGQRDQHEVERVPHGFARQDESGHGVGGHADHDHGRLGYAFNPKRDDGQIDCVLLGEVGASQRRRRRRRRHGRLVIGDVHGFGWKKKTSHYSVIFSGLFTF